MGESTAFGHAEWCKRPVEMALGTLPALFARLL